MFAAFVLFIGHLSPERSNALLDTWARIAVILRVQPRLPVTGTVP